MMPVRATFDAKIDVVCRFRSLLESSCQLGDGRKRRMQRAGGFTPPEQTRPLVIQFLHRL